MNQIASNRQYYPALDGLRGLCCLLVIFYHMFYFAISQYLHLIWISIDIFFVLSGFLITNILLNTPLNKKSIKIFYFKRALRVFPLYYLVLIIFLIIFPLFNIGYLSFKYYVDNQLWFWFFLQNWLLTFKPTNQSGLVHLWSIAVEEQFYLLWPLIILVFKKPSKLLFIIGGLLIAVLITRFFLWNIKSETIAYGNLYSFTRIDGICVGCIVAILKKMKPEFLNKNIAIIVILTALLNFAFYFLNKNNSMPYFGIAGFFTFSVVVGLLVDEIARNSNSIFTIFFNISFLKFIGKISYGTYIFHLPIYIILRPVIEQWSDNNIGFMPSAYFTSSILTLFSFVVGYLSYKYFEKYFMGLKKGFMLTDSQT